MRVLMASTSYPVDATDWRGTFIRNLAFALAARPDLALQLWSPPGDTPPGSSWAHVADDSRWLATLMAEGGIAHQLRTRPLRGAITALGLLRRLRRAYRGKPLPDTRHVNWLQNALALPADGVPLVATVLGTDLQLLRIPGMAMALRRVFRNRPTTLCPNADWMVPILERRFGSVARIRYVPFGVDQAWFDIRREEVAAPYDWICVSRLTTGKIGPLFEWGSRYFRGSNRSLHLFGPMQESMDIPEWVRYHGSATPAFLAKEWFPRAAGLITLSRHAEGRPQVMLEAMASGLPILASRLPAHEDFIEHGRTGWLCASPQELESGLEAVESPRGKALGSAAKAWVSDEVGTWSDCAARFHAIHLETMAQSRSG